MRKTVKKIGAAMLTAVMAVSAVPASVYIFGISDSTAITASASVDENAREFNDSKYKLSYGTKFHYSLDQYQTNCSMPAYIKAQIKDLYCPEIAPNIDHLYMTSLCNYFFEWYNKGQYNNRLVSLSNKESIFNAGMLDDNADLRSLVPYWQNVDIHKIVTNYFPEEVKNGKPSCFCFFNDPLTERIYCVEKDALDDDWNYVACTSTDKCLLWFYEDGEKTYYRNIETNEILNRITDDNTLSSGAYNGCVKCYAESDTGLEYYYNENNDKIYRIYSLEQLKTFADKGISANVFIVNQITVNSGEEADINLNNSIVSGKSESSLFNIKSGGKISVRNAVFADIKGTDGSVIHNSGTAKLYNVSFENCTSSNNGGAIYNSTGAEIQLFADTANEAVNITGCTASRNGGAIYNAGTLWVGESDDVGAITISGCHGVMGAGIYNSGELHVMQNVTIKDNIATLYGGSGKQGGGIYNAGTANVHEATISGNSADNGGGGIFNTRELHLEGTKITGNWSNEKGAGVYAGNNIHIGGALNITENKTQIDDSHSFAGNVYLETYASEGQTQRPKLIIDNLDNKNTGIKGSKIGVTVAYSGEEFTSDYSKLHKGTAPSNFFTADDSANYTVEWNSKNTEAILAEKQHEKLFASNLSLTGDICINFYMELDDMILNDKTAYMQFTVPNGNSSSISKVKVSDGKPFLYEGKTYYKFSCGVAAKQMTDNIKVQLFYNNGNSKGQEYNYTIKKYAEKIIDNENDNEEYEKAAPMIEAMLNYGAYAQTYFGYNTNNLANADDGLEAPNVDSAKTALAKWKYSNYKKENLPEDISFKSSSINLDSTLGLNLYFESEGKLTASTTSYGVTRNVRSSNITDTYKKITFENLKPNEYDQLLEIKINDTYSMKYCPLSYFYSAVSLTDTDEETENLRNVVAALYEFYVEIKDYVTNS